jgi:hypothetical protein
VQIRQGDVYLIPVESIPDSAKPVAREGGRVILAHGEVTGHAHAITAPSAVLLAVPGKTAEVVDRFLRLRSKATLRHEEHGHIEVPAGCYRVVVHEEWSDEMEPRPVLD